MSKQHADSTPDEKAPNGTTLSADEVLVEAARNGDTTAVRVGLEKLSPDTDSKTVAFDAVHEACRENHDECLALLLPYVETTQMGFGMLLSECIHADHTACTEVLLQHWKSVCSNVAFVPHGQEGKKDRPCPAMWEDPAVCQVLIDAGADIETKDDLGRSPLHLACRSGELDVAKMLVKAGAGMCVTDNDGDTCLTLASYSGHTETLKMLVEAGADVSVTVNNIGFSCLTMAACFGRTETVRYLLGLPEVDVNHVADDFTALHWACQEDYRNMQQLLIDAGADIEAKDENGHSPLLLASKDASLDTVKILLKAGADVSATDNKGHTCLLLAAWNGHTETVRYLLCLPEVDANQSHYRGYTSLHRAVLQKHSDVVEVLIDAGADIEAKRDGIGKTPLQYACEVGEREIVRMLLEAGADIEAKDENGRSPLLLASKEGSLDTVKMLLEAGAEVCATDEGGDTCLMFAAAYGHTETVSYLVGLNEVEINHRNNDDSTALEYASRNLHAGVEQVLLEHGASDAPTA